MTRPTIQLSGEASKDIEMLRTRIESTDLTESLTLCVMLARIQTPAAGEALRDLTRHAEETVRAAAVPALSERLSEPETMDRLRFALGDARAAVVEAAVHVVGSHELSAFRNELRALAAMPNEAASAPWLRVANEALAVLSKFCSVEDLDLGTRAFADQKLERGGSLLLNALVRHLPVETLLPFLDGQRELCIQLFAGLTNPDGEARLKELANCGHEPTASLAKKSLEAWQRNTLPPHIEVALRLPLESVRAQQHDGSRRLEYHFSQDKELNQRLSAVLNTACLVFHEHVDGDWEAVHRNVQAAHISVEIRANPWLIKRLFALKDRVIAGLTYRAIQLRDR